MVNGTGGAVLAGAATGCGAAFGGCGSGCPREEAGSNCAADSSVSTVAGDEDGFADRWAFALNVSSNEAIITQRHVHINSTEVSFFAFVEHFEKQRFSGGRAHGRRCSLAWALYLGMMQA